MTSDINELACNGLVIAETIARHSRRPELIITKEDRQVFAVPDGYTLQTDDLIAKLMPTPARKSGTVSLDTVESFIEYVKKHAHDATTIWCKTDLVGGQANFTAIFNDHQDFEGFDTSEPGWRDFRAQFTPKLSVEWKTWIGQDQKRMSQADFATFIDDNLKDIASAEGRPTGSEMLELATRFEITQDKRFRSAVRLQSGGINLEYVENDDEGTIERMKMFDRFALGVAPFWRGEGYRLDARLKYTLREGGLKLWYELVRPDIAFEHATESVIKQIAEALDRPVLFGNAQ